MYEQNIESDQKQLLLANQDNLNQDTFKENLPYEEDADIEKKSVDFNQSSEDNRDDGEDDDNEKENFDHLYDLPKMENVTRAVLIKLTIACVIALIFLAIEVAGGIISGSLAILSDAAHMFSDLSGFFISIFSVWIGTKPASSNLSYGYHRAEVIGALASIVLIWGLTILLLYEATHRVINQEQVDEPLYMLITAGFGLFCNVIMAKVLHSTPGHTHHNHSHGHSHDHQEHDHTHKHHHHDKNKKVKQKIESVGDKDNKNIKQIQKKEENQQSIGKDQNEKNQGQNLSHDHEKNQNLGHDNKKMSENLEQDNKNEECKNEHSECGSDHIQSEDKCKHEHDQEDKLQNDQTGQQNEERRVQQTDLNINKDSVQGTEHNSSDIIGNNNYIRYHYHDHYQNHNHEHNQNGACRGNRKNKNLSVISSKENYNLRAAMIHVIGDIIQSIGVLIAAFLIYAFGGDHGFNYWHLADPICTYLFSILVLFTTIIVSKDCIRVLMEGTPNEINIEHFKEQLQAIEFVQEIHDLHIWSLSKGKPSMSCHIFVSANPKNVLRESTKLCRQNGIYHSTIQIEQFSQKGQPGYIKCEHNIHH